MFIASSKVCSQLATVLGLKASHHINMDVLLKSSGVLLSTMCMRAGCITALLILHCSDYDVTCLRGSVMQNIHKDRWAAAFTHPLFQAEAAVV